MPTFESRPVTIEAVQFFNDKIESLPEWAKRQLIYAHDINRYYIRTLEGNMYITETDWIIQGLEGEVYPCKDSVFQRKYAQVQTKQILHG